MPWGERGGGGGLVFLLCLSELLLTEPSHLLSVGQTANPLPTSMLSQGGKKRGGGGGYTSDMFFTVGIGRSLLHRCLGLTTVFPACT